MEREHRISLKRNKFSADGEASKQSYNIIPANSRFKTDRQTDRQREPSIALASQQRATLISVIHGTPRWVPTREMESMVSNEVET